MSSSSSRTKGYTTPSTRASSGSSTSGRDSKSSSAQRGRRKSAQSKLPCEICGELYSRIDNLRVHQRMHSGDMPYRCKYCNQPFRWSGACRTHERSHQENPKFVGKSRHSSRRHVETDNVRSESLRTKRDSRRQGYDRRERTGTGSSSRRTNLNDTLLTFSEDDPAVGDLMGSVWPDVLDD